MFFPMVPPVPKSAQNKPKEIKLKTKPAPEKSMSLVMDSYKPTQKVDDNNTPVSSPKDEPKPEKSKPRDSFTIGGMTFNLEPIPASERWNPFDKLYVPFLNIVPSIDYMGAGSSCLPFIDAAVISWGGAIGFFPGTLIEWPSIEIYEMSTGRTVAEYTGFTKEYYARNGFEIGKPKEETKETGK